LSETERRGGQWLLYIVKHCSIESSTESLGAEITLSDECHDSKQGKAKTKAVDRGSPDVQKPS